MPDKSWIEIVASSLDWEEAHLKLENTLKNLGADLRGKRPEGASHSVWEILEHIRIAQWDLLEFCTNPKYEHKLKWPDDYWPKSPAPANDKAWNESIQTIQKDRDALKKFLIEKGDAATGKIPWGSGQTFLRTVLLTVDHTAYHLGELVTVRRLLGAWPPE
jgi:uncharacterized damage-inducible protein DinB